MQLLKTKQHTMEDIEQAARAVDGFEDSVFWIKSGSDKKDHDTWTLFVKGSRLYSCALHQGTREAERNKLVARFAAADNERGFLVRVITL